MMQKQIGILGGTFNPVHLGHLMLAETAREELSLDRVIFLPSGISYMKRQTEILPGELRLELVRQAVMDNPFFEVSDMELKRKGNSYTWETLKAFQQEAPSASYTFLIGADSLFQIENWRFPERIFASCRIAAAIRGEMDDTDCQNKADELKERFGADVVILHERRMDISSTDIRKRCLEGKSIRYLVPEAVRSLMEQQGLYQSTKKG